MLPNIAVIRALKLETRSLKRDIEFFYIGEKNSIEERLIREEGVPFFGIHAGKMRRYFDLKNIADVFKIPLGIFESLRILRRVKPKLVFSKGGYVSVPVCLAAWMLKVPVWIHESDVSPGLATKICRRFAQKIFLSFEESKQFFPGRPVEVVGNPIRKEVTQGKPEKGYELTGFSPKHPVVLIMGGSTGSQFLNEMVAKILPELEREKIQVVHITGPHPATFLPPASPWYRSFAFLNKELPHIYAVASLVISRAGSGSIFEILACGKKLILIPLPRAGSRGDQIENAEVCEKHGWAKVLLQEGLTAGQLKESILEALKHKGTPRITKAFFLSGAETLGAIIDQCFIT